MIETFAEKIPVELRHRSGKVFYSGRTVFSAPNALYVLGINPGGDPSLHIDETVENHSATVLHLHPSNWSAYRDEKWMRATTGTYGMAPRVLHLFAELGLNPGCVPCSNLVFVRSRREGDIHHDEMTFLANACWPFHKLVIELLRPRVILCFGKTVGKYVRNMVGTNTLDDEFFEQNNRMWRSQTFTGNGVNRVIVATHPSIADWSNPNTDPTKLIRNAIVL